MKKNECEKRSLNEMEAECTTITTEWNGMEWRVVECRERHRENGIAMKNRENGERERMKTENGEKE